MMISVQNKLLAFRMGYYRLYRLVLCSIVFFLAGCADSVVRQYSELGPWTQSTDSPTVLSGTPDIDQAAYDASEETIGEADWKVLEQIAPRPIWERIGEAKRDAQGRLLKRGPVPAHKRTKTSTAPRTLMPQNVTISKRPDGMLRMVYPLRHFGGAIATSAYDGGTQRRAINVETVDLSPLVAMINDQLGEQGSCSALPSENALVITCGEQARDNVLQLLADIDLPPSQVEITARIFEMRHEFDFQFGARSVLDHIASDGTQNLASNFSTKSFLDSLGNPGLGDFAFQGSALRIFQVFGNSGISLDATFQALADTGLVREVASPRMTVMARRTASMLAGQELPIQTARYASDTIITEKTTYKPIGVQLYVTPQTIGEDSVKLHALTIVSSVAGFNPRMSLIGSDSIESLVNPIINSREAETSVAVPDGCTLVIGGLRMVRHITRERKIPGLGDIWGLEWFFKNHRSQRQLSDLYFFITPHIIQSDSPSNNETLKAITAETYDMLAPIDDIPTTGENPIGDTSADERVATDTPETPQD